MAAHDYHMVFFMQEMQLKVKFKMKTKTKKQDKKRFLKNQINKS